MSSPGVHFLASPAVLSDLVASSGVGAGDLVVDFGAGEGVITARLATTGARVLAVERDPAFVRRLRRRFDHRPTVRVVPADLRTVALPRRSYAVVASIPFALSTPLLRRLLAAGTSMTGADLIVEWGLARRLTATRAASFETAWWATRFDLRLDHRIPARCFRPAPAVDAAHLTIRRAASVGSGVERVLWPLLRAAYAEPSRPVRGIVAELAPKRRAHRLMVSTGIDPPAAAATVSATQWRSLATALAGDPGLSWPRLPRAAMEAPRPRGRELG